MFLFLNTNLLEVMVAFEDTNGPEKTPCTNLRNYQKRRNSLSDNYLNDTLSSRLHKYVPTTMYIPDLNGLRQTKITR